MQFQPNYYSLSDHGAVAIVEMDVLASGRRLFVLGGGSFQGWIRQQFLKRNNNNLTLINSFWIASRFKIVLFFVISPYEEHG